VNDIKIIEGLTCPICKNKSIFAKYREKSSRLDYRCSKCPELKNPPEIKFTQEDEKNKIDTVFVQKLLNDILDEVVHKCLNPDCNTVLFISGKISQEAEIKGIDRDVGFKRDDGGEYIKCPKCGSKHDILAWDGPKGSGQRWKISGLRK